MTVDHKIFDLVVIGGGINGVGIAHDAAQRGLSVLLCEQGDLAGATSSASSKLIHGGLRYLEQYQFRLVKKALIEREVLLKLAPHIVWPLRFCLPHQQKLRSQWLIRLGLFLYDHLASENSFVRSAKVLLGESSPLLPNFSSAFEYSDAWVDDARLVIINALAAQQCGATILTHCQCMSAQSIHLAKQSQPVWQLQLQNGLYRQQVVGKTVINAAGPWVNQVAETVFAVQPSYQVRLIKGSHIVVPRIHQQEKAYILQNSDGRVVFVLPFQRDFSLIGTTDIEQHQLDKIQISPTEIQYLLDVVNGHFKQTVTTADIVHSFSGVRPLFEDTQAKGQGKAQQLSRDYLIHAQQQDNLPPLYTIYGGKVTTYRKLAEQAVDCLSAHFEDLRPSRTATSVLPGGDIQSHAELIGQIQQQYPFLSTDVTKRYAHSYGSLAFHFLTGAECLTDLGMDFGCGLHQAEVNYLTKHEWAHTAEDILWRRTKLGLYFSPAQIQALADYLAAKVN